MPIILGTLERKQTIEYSYERINVLCRKTRGGSPGFYANTDTRFRYLYPIDRYSHNYPGWLRWRPCRPPAGRRRTASRCPGCCPAPRCVWACKATSVFWSLRHVDVRVFPPSVDVRKIIQHVAHVLPSINHKTDVSTRGINNDYLLNCCLTSTTKTKSRFINMFVNDLLWWWHKIYFCYVDSVEQK